MKSTTGSIGHARFSANRRSISRRSASEHPIVSRNRTSFRRSAARRDAPATQRVWSAPSTSITGMPSTTGYRWPWPQTRSSPAHSSPSKSCGQRSLSSNHCSIRLVPSGERISAYLFTLPFPGYGPRSIRLDISVEIGSDGRDQPLAVASPGEPFGGPSRAAAHFGEPASVLRRPFQSGAQSERFGGWNYQPFSAIRDHVRGAAAIGRNHGYSGRHGLQQNQPEAIKEGRKHEQVAAPANGGDPIVRYLTQFHERNTVAADDPLAKPLRPASGEGKANGAARHTRKRLKQVMEALLRTELAGKKDLHGTEEVGFRPEFGRTIQIDSVRNDNDRTRRRNARPDGAAGKSAGANHHIRQLQFAAFAIEFGREFVQTGKERDEGRIAFRFGALPGFSLVVAGGEVIDGAHTQFPRPAERGGGGVFIAVCGRIATG